MSFDLPDAKLPDLRALQNSWVENDPLAAEMNQLTVQLFKDSLAEQTFDINVLGVPHLGSFSLVRRAVNADGLALLVISSELEELVGYADRVIIMRDRKQVAEIPLDKLSVPAIMNAIAA